jgi:hypothetical protein
MAKAKTESTAAASIARDALTATVIDALAKSWPENKDAVIARLIRERPDVYFRVMADLVPKQVQATIDTASEFRTMSEAELRAYVNEPPKPRPTEGELVRLFAKNPGMGERILRKARLAAANDPVVEIIDDMPKLPAA